MRITNNIIETKLRVSFAHYGLILSTAIFIGLGILFLLPTEGLHSILSTLIFFSIGWIAILTWSKNAKDHSQVVFIKKIYLLSFFTRIGFVFILYLAHLAYELPLFAAEYGGVFFDDLGFHERSFEIAQEIREYGFYEGFMLSRFYYLGNFGYAYLNAIIYYLLNDPNTIIIRLVNALFSALTPALCFFISYSVYGNLKIAKYSAILTAIFPTFIVFSAVQYKDTIVIFLIFYVIWVSLRIRERITATSIGLLFISFSILATFRSTAALALLAIVAIHFFIQKKIPSLLITVLTIFIGFTIIYLLLMQDYLKFWHPSHLYGLSQNLNYEYIKTASSTSLIGRLLGADSGKLVLLVFNFILFAVAPLPNSNLGIFTLILPGVWIWYLLIPTSIYGLFYSIKHKPKESWILYGFFSIVFFMITISFLGSNFRYRAQIMPILLIFCSIGIFHFKKLKHLYFLYVLSLPLFGLAYYCIKYHG